MVRPVIGMNGAYYVDHLGMFQSQLNKQYILLRTHMPQCHICTQQQSGEQHHCCTVYRAHVDDRQRRQPPNTKDTLCLLTLSPHFVSSLWSVSADIGICSKLQSLAEIQCSHTHHPTTPVPVISSKPQSSAAQQYGHDDEGEHQEAAREGPATSARPAG